MFSKSTLIESGVIGVLAGGWASCTYWTGLSGVFMGFLAFCLSSAALLIKEEEKKEVKKKKHASPYKNARTAGTAGH